MRYNSILFLICILFLFYGCIPSIHPLYTEKDVVFEPSLLGTWIEKEDSKDKWVFEKSDSNSYKLILSSESKASEFLVHLVKIGEYLFFDFYPIKNDTIFLNKINFFEQHYIPVHTFSKVELKNNILEMKMLEPQWLEKAIEQEDVVIAHEKTKDVFVITASTQELQKFFLAYANDENAFSVSSKLTKK